MNEFQKQTVFLRGWLQGRGYNIALEAMEFARQYHQGTRKDNVTPEFAHQTEIAMHASVLPGLILSAALMLVFAGDALAQGARDRAPKVIELEEMVIEGKVAKPQVFYILTRRDVRYEGLRMDLSFLNRIIGTVRDNPF